MSYLEEEKWLKKQHTVYCSLKKNKKKTSHSQKTKDDLKKKKVFLKCNAGQPQVPERGRKVSRVGKLMMKLSGLGLSSTSCLQVFKLKAPPSLSSSDLNKNIIKKIKKISIPKPTSLQTIFFFDAENNWTNARCFFLNECFFFFIWNQWYACSNNFYRRPWKATCFGELLLWVVYKDLTVYSQSVDLSWGRHVEVNKEGIMFQALFLSNIADVVQRTTARLRLWQT